MGHSVTACSRGPQWVASACVSVMRPLSFMYGCHSCSFCVEQVPATETSCGLKALQTYYRYTVKL